MAHNHRLVVAERVEWPDKGAVRHKLTCDDTGCNCRIKITGGPIDAIDRLVDQILAAAERDGLA